MLGQTWESHRGSVALVNEMNLCLKSVFDLKHFFDTVRQALLGGGSILWLGQDLI